jgi:hypothetical protein
MGEMKMKWDELSPRERDALVAEHVMGWKPSPTLIDGWVLQDGTHINHGGFHPSTNIAGQVVEKMYEKGFTMDILMYSDGCYSVKVYQIRKGYLFETSLDNPTAPEAICKAALNACGVAIE